MGRCHPGARVALNRTANAKTVVVQTAEVVNLPLAFERAARRGLVRSGKRPFEVSVTFTPTGGSPATATKTVVLKLQRHR